MTGADHVQDAAPADCGHRCGAHGGRTRRAVLGGLAAGAAALAGCGGGGGTAEPPDPIALEGQLQCEVCGMVIGSNFGPNGQIFYREESPAGHDNPAYFDALPACLFPYHFQKQTRGWEATAVYVTDYSATDYEITTMEGRTYISSHVAAETFAAGSETTLVVGSDLQGAMGADFFPFSERADAEALRAEYGGKLRAFEEVDTQTLAQYG